MDSLPKSVFVCMALVLTLSACQTTNDPAKGGFFSGISNLSSGGYQQRVDQKHGDLAQAEAEQSALQNQATALDQQQAHLTEDLAAAEQRLATLRADMETLDQRIEEAATRQELDQKERRRLKEQLEDLRQAERLLATDPVVDIETKQRRIKELERRREILEETLAEALAS